MPRLSLTLVALLVSTAALAQTPDCSTPITQMDMNICAEADWQEADAALNTAYREVMAEMQAMDADLPENLQGAEAALRTAQRSWITFRDAHCTTEGFQMRGGSAEPLVVYGCLRELTVERTEDLRNLVNY